MCDKKPGRRCSSDTKNSMHALQATNDRLDQEMAEQYTKDSESPDYNGMESSEHADLAYEYDKNRVKLNEAKLNFYTTPEGMKVLEEKLDTEAGRERMVDFQGTSREDGSLVEASAKMPAGIVTSAKLHAAKSHREWQKETLESLNEAEENSPEAALFAATELRKNMEKRLKVLKRKQSASDINTNYDASIENYSKTPNTDTRQKLADAYHAHEKHDANVKYAKLKVEDLKSYEADMSKKVPHSSAPTPVSRKTLSPKASMLKNKRSS
jgi:hypothetical protein